MKGLSEYVISLLELLEAQGRVAKRATIKVAIAVGMVMLGSCLVVGAVGFLVAALFMGLHALMPAWAAALVMGLLFLAVVGAIALYIRSLLR